jgi:ABC-type nitrate/sulfonate/bicarbonate transport system permease component
MDSGMAEVSLAMRVRTSREPRLRPETRLQIATVAGVWLLWEALAWSGLFYRDIVPSSFKVIAAMGRLLVTGAFYGHLGITAYEVLVGFAIGAVAGVLLGILFGARPFLGRVMNGYILALAPAPKVIFLPVLMTAFGIGVGSKIAMAALSAFFPTVLSTAAGMALINPTLIKVGRSFNATAAQMVTRIYLPALVLPVISGLRLGLGVAIVGTLIAEIKMSNAGLGFIAIQYYERFRIPEMYAVIVIIFVLATAANWLMTRLSDRLGRHGMPSSAEISGAA